MNVGCDAVLTATDVAAGYTHRRRRVVILEHVDLTLAPGELACLLGPNGAGKSTLLRTLVGGQPALAGRITLAQHDLAELTPRQRAQHLSVVLTDRVDVGYLTARALIEFGRTPHIGWFTKLAPADHRIVDWAIDAAGAGNVADHMVHELSDGERQRVMIARALAQQPTVLVLDEPTAFLDLTRRVELMALLRRLTATTELAVLMSTHELDLALRNADTVWVIRPDGSFGSGAPEDLALAGDLEAAFSASDVSFDHARTGSFLVGAPDGERPALAIDGSGSRADWAARAAQRAGWRIVADPTLARAVVGTDSRHGGWRCRCIGEDTTDCADLAELVRVLRRLRVPPPVNGLADNDLPIAVKESIPR